MYPPLNIKLHMFYIHPPFQHNPEIIFPSVDFEMFERAQDTDMTRYEFDTLNDSDKLKSYCAHSKRLSGCFMFV